MAHEQFRPLTEAEREARNTTATPPSEQLRLYARDLRVTAECYATAASARGLAKSASRYLYAESLRLTAESGIVFDRADELEMAEVSRA